MTHIAIDNGADARAALSDARLITPKASASLGTGSTAALREAMARFNDGDTHPDPRADVERAIGRITSATLTDTAARRTLRHIAPFFDGRDLAFVVPAESLALGLGVDEVDLAVVVTDIEEVVRAIGRGEVASSETDRATDRLTNRFSDHPDGAVAAISLLYQVFDSAAALFSVSLVAERTNEPRRNALPKTVRRAIAPVTIGNNSIEVDTTVTVSLETDGLEFGAGRHQCPGEVLAYAIVDGMLSALTDIELATDEIVTSADGRPATLPMYRR